MLHAQPPGWLLQLLAAAECRLMNAMTGHAQITSEEFAVVFLLWSRCNSDPLLRLHLSFIELKHDESEPLIIINDNSQAWL